MEAAVAAVAAVVAAAAAGRAWARRWKVLKSTQPGAGQGQG